MTSGIVSIKTLRDPYPCCDDDRWWDGGVI